MRLGAGMLLAIATIAVCGTARAADESTLRNLQAPPPAQLRPLEEGLKARPVRFARLLVQLKPEPWAFVRIGDHYSGATPVWGQSHLVTWEGQQDMDLSSVGSVFAEELQRAGMPVVGADESLFGQGPSADFQVGVKVTEMQGRFCQYCGAGRSWRGAVVMTAHWEIYSNLERKVLATVDTQGGFSAPPQGLDGEPDRLIIEAFRDNVRRLAASENYRRLVTGSPIAASGDLTSTQATATPIAFRGPTAGTPLAQASKSVVIVYAADGQGSGFLVSAEGYVLTNQHVVGGSKYVKLKWANGVETLGEVVRADRRRDVALIKAEARGRAPLSLRTGAVQQGETVFAVGTPLDDSLQNTMTKGIVSAERVEKGLRFIQSDAGINHGNSGGPLLDDKGEVVAIAVSGVLPDSHQMGLNFFIPIDDALKALALTPAAAPPAAAAAKAVRPKG